MAEQNLAVFGDIIQNREIPSFWRMLNLAREIFHQEFKAVEIMPGGLTNKNFKITLEDGRDVAIRVAGIGTSNYINRPAEKHNATQMASIGIAPEVYFYDAESGSQLCEFVEGPTLHMADFQTRDEVLTQAAVVMHKYHNSGLEFKSSFDPIAKIGEYRRILKEAGYEKRYEGWDRIVKTLDALTAAYKKNPPRQVPCHNDTLAENFMYDADLETMRVIDWEYGGMNDAYYDTACVCVENLLSKKCEDTFFSAYCGGKPTDEERARLLINKFLVTSHWSTWSLVQISYGKDEEFYWEYGRTRAVQACGFLDEPDFARYLELIG